MNVNLCVFAGNLTRDPDLRFTAGEKAVASGTIAVNRKYTKADGTKAEEVIFVDIEVWGQQAETLCKFATKGTGILVEGRMKQERWEKDGQKHSKLVLVANGFQFSGAARGTRSEPTGPNAANEPTPPTVAGQQSSATGEAPPF